MKINGSTPAPTPPRENDPLLKISREFESVLIRQMLQAMRDTQGDDGILEPSPGEEMFTSLLDDVVAASAAETMDSSLSEALYRQLSRKLNKEG